MDRAALAFRNRTHIAFSTLAHTAFSVGLALLLFAPNSLQAAAHPDLRDPCRDFAEYKIYDFAGRPFRLPIEDWEGARERVKKDSAWQQFLSRERAEVDEWIAKRRDHVEWVAGWWHDFVSPQDGSFLTWTPEEPGPETLSSPSDPKVKLTPKLHAAWVYVFRGRHGEKMFEAARLWRLTGDEKFAAWVAGQLDFYAGNFTRWPEQKRGTARSRLFWQSLDEAVNLVRHANAARLVWDYAQPRQKELWRTNLFEPQCALLNQGFQFIHNISCWHRTAVGCVAALYGDDKLWALAVEGPFGIREQMRRGITDDYFWFEQSMGYNSYVARALMPFFEFAALTGRAGSLSNELCRLENLALAPASIRFPTGQVPNPADSTGGLPHAPNRALLASMYRVFPTHIGLEEVSRGRTWDTLLDPPPPASSTFKVPEVASRNLDATRFAVLRRGPWQVFFHYGQLNASHAQREALNVELFCGTADISHDPGTVGYGSPLHREFYTQGAAHNVPLVNGHGQEGWNPGELVRFDADRASVHARQPAYRRDAAAERELHLEQDRLIDTVRVHLKTNVGSARLGLALHLQGRVALPGVFSSDSRFAAAPEFKHWQGARAASFRDQAEFDVRIGDRRLRLSLNVPGRFRVVHASTPDVPPAKRESLYLECSGTNAVFTSVYQLVE